MPSRPCPHCPLKFASQSVLDTHIIHVHSTNPAAEPAAHAGHGFLAMTGGQNASVGQGQGQGQGTGAQGGAMQYPYPPTAPTGYTAPVANPPPMPGNPSAAPAQGGYTAQPPASQQSSALSTTFAVVHDDRNTNPRFDVPIDEAFDVFLGRFGEIEKAAMRYSLVDRQGHQESMERLLSGNLFYQAMISELVKRPAAWDHAVVWQKDTGEAILQD